MRREYHETDKVYQRMRTKTKIEVLIETRKRITIRGRGKRALWCQACGATVGMILPEQAAILKKTTPREIYRRIEKGELHFVETRV